MLQTNYPDDDSWIQLLVIAALITVLSVLFMCSTRADSQITTLDWFSEDAQCYINKDTGLWRTGETASIIDVDTGLQFQAVRYRGTNHADFEPVTQSDTDTLKTIYGEWSWSRRAIVVFIKGEAFAASMNGMPHGTESILDNGYKGHSCIHFTGSKTHGSNRVDDAHQAQVEIAKTFDLSGVGGWY